MTRSLAFCLRSRRAVALAAFLVAAPAAAQTAGDYRSRQTGNWDTAATWQRYTGSAWVTASVAPDKDDGTITVRAGHTVTLDKDTDVDQLVVAASGVLVGSAKLTLKDGPGVDLQVYGSFAASKTVEQEGASALTVYAGGLVNVLGEEYILKDDAQADVYGRLEVRASLLVEKDALFRVHSGGVLDNRATVSQKNDSAIEVSGRFVNRATYNQLDATSLEVQDGGVFEHARDGGTLPSISRSTFGAGSTITVTGVANTLPVHAGVDSAVYHHLTWDSPAQTAMLQVGTPPFETVGGTFTIASTGSGSLFWTSDATPLHVAGDYVQTGGIFVYAYGSGAGTMAVDGDVRVSAGTMGLTTSSRASTLRVAGDFVLTGGTLDVGAGRSADVVFDGTTPQTITATGTIASRDIDFIFDNAAGVTALSAIDLPDDVDVARGTLDLGAYDFRVGGDLRVDGDLVGVERLTFDGGSNQAVDYARPLTVSRLLVDTPHTVTLTDATLDVTHGIEATAGTFNLNGQPVTMKATGGQTATIFVEGATITGDANLTVERAFGSGGNGWRMIAAPVSGVPYSALNGPFHTQGAPWARSETGSATLQRLDTAAQDWVALDGADAAFAPGQGYIFYMWEQAPDGTDQFPAVWTVTGSRSTLASVPLGFNTSPSDSYSLVGNPWVANLDWDATVAASTGVGTSYAVWDPALTHGGGLSGYRYYNAAGGTGAAGPYVPPLQAFSAQATASGATLVFATSRAANEGAPTYLGKTGAGEAEGPADPSPHVRLHLEGEGLGESETYLVFDEAARAGRDDFDVDRLPSIAEARATLWFEAEDGARLAFDGRSMASGRETFALRFAATAAGTYTLSWPDWHGVPETWELRLHDRETGREVDLRTQASASFALEAGEPEAARFAIEVVDPARAAPAAPGADAVRLAPATPNPVAHSTTLRYAVPSASAVRLAVYDVLGREVAVLVDGEQGEGWHTVRWSPSLPSGAYFVRLVAGGTVRVGKLVVAR